MDAAPNVRLRLSNRAENVLIVRQALSGLAETVGLDAVALNDVSTAVTEAANNVVLHAYEGGEGPLEVELACTEAGLEVLVSDRGCGIPPDIRSGETVSDGIGLPVIQALSDSVEFRDRAPCGTDVAMRFELAQDRPLNGLERLDIGGETIEPDNADAVGLDVAPMALARGVVPRVLATLAARAYFTTDRISDAQLVADAIVAELGAAGRERVLMGALVAPRELELQIGPLAGPRAGELLTGLGQGGLGSVLERLTDGHEMSGAGELRLRMSQRD